MPLTTSPSQIAAAEILGELRYISGEYSSAANRLNRITQHILGLDNTSLAAFGNALGALEMQRLIATHNAQGAAVNDLLASVQFVLAEAQAGTLLPVPESIPQVVDVRPLADKLAEQGREILTSELGVFSVVDLPAPEPEP